MKATRKIEAADGKVQTFDRQGLVSLIDREAREKLGISGEEALRRIRQGRTGASYIWADLRMLAALLR